MTKRERSRKIEFRRQAEEATRSLRTGDSALMRRLREVLTGKGIDPIRSALIGVQVDDLYHHAGGSLVLPNGDLIVFGFDWGGSTMDRAELTIWFVDNDATSRSAADEILEEERRRADGPRET